jgi:hypothetical protein
MFNLWLCVFIHILAMPPIYDPHLPTAEDYQEALDESDVGLELKRKLLDELYPDNAPHDVQDAKNFAQKR